MSILLTKEGSFQKKQALSATRRLPVVLTRQAWAIPSRCTT